MSGQVPFSHGVAFLAIAVAWSWTAWGTAIVLDLPASGGAGLALFLVGGAGVPLAALALLVARDGPETRRDFLARLVDARRLGGWGALAALGLPLAIAVAAAALAGEGAGALAPLAARAAEPLGLAGILVFLLAFGPLPEEIGWRGYALPALQPRTGALAAAAAIGAVHALWHVPLFHMDGTFQAGLGAGGMAFWRFLAGLLALSVVAATLYNVTGGSTLSAVLLHFSENAAGELLALSDTAQWIRFALWAGLALAVVVLTRGRLGYPERRPAAGERSPHGR